MNWSRASSSGNANYYHQHALLDKASSYTFPQLTLTPPHSFEEYLPSVSDHVYDRDMSELCSIILSDGFCNSSNGVGYSNQNSATTTEVSTTSTCTQYSQENFMPANNLAISGGHIPLDSHQDPGAGSYNNYGQETYDIYGQDYYAGLGSTTELSASCCSFYDNNPLPSSSSSSSSPSHALINENINIPLDASPSSYRQLVSPRELQEVFDDLARRPTDPVGKVTCYRGNH